MASMIVRLFGRFVHALPTDQQGQRLGHAYAIAIDPKQDPALRENPKIHTHRPFMAAARKSLLSVPGRLPDFDLAAGTDLSFAEQQIWNLQGCDVVIGSGKSPFSIALERNSASAIVLPMLEELIGGGTAKFSRASLKPTALSGLVTATVTFRSGYARLYQVDSDISDFAPFNDLHHHSPILKSARLADVMEVTLPDDDATLTIKGPNNVAPITIAPSPYQAGGTVVNISNLCPAFVSDADLEFAGFYGVLEFPPNIADRLVPVVSAHFGEDCYKSAGVTFIE